MDAALHAAQLRLARFYLQKLRIADMAVRRGQSSAQFGIALFDQEWEHIRQWGTWVAEHRASDSECVVLCRDFALAGLEVMANRSSYADIGPWLTQGLHAAQTLHDSPAERTLLHELSRTYQRYSAIDEAEHYARQLLERAEAAHDRVALGRAHGELGGIAEERGHYAEAKIEYERAVAIFADQGLAMETAYAVHGLGAVALYTGDHEKACVHFRREIELAEVAGTRSELCTALVSLAEALEAPEEAQPFLMRATELADSLGFPRLQSITAISRANWAVEQADLEVSCQYFEQGIAYARRIGSPRNVIHGLSSLGYVLFRLGRCDEAIVRLEQGIEMARDLKIPRYLCNLQRNRANALLSLQRLEEARLALRESVELAIELHSDLQKIRSASVAVAYMHQASTSEQAAHWAGVILGDSALDQPVFTLVCNQIEEAIGKDRYQHALETGKCQSLDNLMDAIVEALSA